MEGLFLTPIMEARHFLVREWCMCGFDSEKGVKTSQWVSPAVGK